MDRGDTTQGLGKPGENVDSYFHPLPSSLSPVQTWQSIEIEGKFASSTRKRQSHLANPGSTELPPPEVSKDTTKVPCPCRASHSPATSRCSFLTSAIINIHIRMAVF